MIEWTISLERQSVGVPLKRQRRGSRVLLLWVTRRIRHSCLLFLVVIVVFSKAVKSSSWGSGLVEPSFFVWPRMRGEGKFEFVREDGFP